MCSIPICRGTRNPATWARFERLSAKPRTVALMMPVVSELDIRALLPTVRVPPSSSSTRTTHWYPPASGKYVAITSRARNTLSCRRNIYHIVRTLAANHSQHVAEFSPRAGRRGPMIGFLHGAVTDIVDSTRRARR